MINWNDRVFIYGSFDFTGKGYGFAYLGKRIKENDKIIVEKLIEKIGNYADEKKHWLVGKTELFYIIMCFSLSGKDEHGRSTLICKGIVLTLKEYEEIDCFPFFLFPSLEIQANNIKSEIQLNQVKLKPVKFNYNFDKTNKIIINSKPNLRKYCIAIWKESKITFPYNNTFLNTLEAIFLISNISQRKKISFITSNASRIDNLIVCFHESLNLPKFKEFNDNSLSKSFSEIGDILLRKDLEQYSDFILEKGKFGRKPLWKKYLKK